MDPEDPLARVPCEDCGGTHRAVSPREWECRRCGAARWELCRNRDGKVVDYVHSYRSGQARRSPLHQRAE